MRYPSILRLAATVASQVRQHPIVPVPCSTGCENIDSSEKETPSKKRRQLGKGAKSSMGTASYITANEKRSTITYLPMPFSARIAGTVVLYVKGNIASVPNPSFSLLIDFPTEMFLDLGLIQLHDVHIVFLIVIMTGRSADAFYMDDGFPCSDEHFLSFSCLIGI